MKVLKTSILLIALTTGLLLTSFSEVSCACWPWEAKEVSGEFKRGLPKIVRVKGELKISTIRFASDSHNYTVIADSYIDERLFDKEVTMNANFNGDILYIPMSTPFSP